MAEGIELTDKQVNALTGITAGDHRDRNWLTDPDTDA